MSSPTKLDAIVTHNLALRKLFRHAAEHHGASLRIKSLLAEPVRSHIQLAVIRDGTLVLTADSSAWAAKMRYQVPDLHRKMAETSEFSEIQTIRVKVTKSSSAKEHDSRRAVPMSAPVAAEMQRRAASVADPALKDALLRLANRRSG